MEEPGKFTLNHYHICAIGYLICGAICILTLKSILMGIVIICLAVTFLGLAILNTKETYRKSRKLILSFEFVVTICYLIIGVLSLLIYEQTLVGFVFIMLSASSLLDLILGIKSIKNKVSKDDKE